MDKIQDEVFLREENVVIPTYPVREPDKNPLFLEKRAYQGSSGRIYPLPMTDKISNTKIEKTYKAVFLENKYLKIMIIPELGGRIQRALDKTNNYDFVYYNEVIKPALVGLAGPWISGGIEFNWPQHHRPSTYSPVDYEFGESVDGSKTLWCSEIDRMYGTKGMAGFTLHPDKAYLEIKGQLYNRTDLPQTFLWWANPAVVSNEHSYSVFPEDVHAVMDHGKRAVSTFPVATGEYYKCDYSAGVDISRYANIPVPTSFMAHHSDYDFVGNFDEQKKAGLLHVADHHISPGKKQWTWGHGDFGKAWDRNLTDKNGPYIELMTGVFTVNQPDFTWLKPQEEKTFVQYFMPYKGVGRVKNASKEAVVSLSLNQGSVEIAVYCTSPENGVKISLHYSENQIWETITDISPEEAFFGTADAGLDEQSLIDATGLTVRVISSEGTILVEYTVPKKTMESVPEAMEELPPPEKLRNCQELFTAGRHLEQYHHATFEPEEYYLEGLKREPEDIRLNNAYGQLLFRSGCFEESEKYFRKAVEQETWLNPNPCNGESFFNLGLALVYLGKDQQAFDAFHKSTWSADTKSHGFYWLACLSCRSLRYTEALEFINQSLVYQYHNLKARALKAAILRHLSEKEHHALTDDMLSIRPGFLNESLEIDRMDVGIIHEKFLFDTEGGKQKIGSDTKWNIIWSVNNYLELALDYSKAGFYDDAINLLNKCTDTHPMVHYYSAWLIEKKGNHQESLILLDKAENTNPDYCFPNKIDEIPILEYALSAKPDLSMAPYYLGNLLYDKKRYAEAAGYWEFSIRQNPDFSIPHRNLAIYFFNKVNNGKKALIELKEAFSLAPGDDRILMELDAVCKLLAYPVNKRFSMLQQNYEIVKKRDELYLEYIRLLNLQGNNNQALTLLSERNFHPWEGGEGKTVSQYVFALTELAKSALEAEDLIRSEELLAKAYSYPVNLGEGKLANTLDNILDYYRGCVREASGDMAGAKAFWQKASFGMAEPAETLYYNDQPSDVIFYQGLACRKLGQPEKARRWFYKLLRYGEKQEFREIRHDFFAVSLPDLSVFQQDIEERNRINAAYLRGLGNLGLGELRKAEEELESVLSRAPDHQGAVRHLAFLYNRSGICLIQKKVDV